MNTKLLELAIKAGLRKDHGSDREYIVDFDWRVFADLVVVEVLAAQDKLICLDGVNAYNLSTPTKEHFGVR